jgi:ATP-dependent phosphofructokinase / diphosphate-dependent phosphofructokinase
MRIGLLTGGGDAPGLNGIIEAATKGLIESGCEVFGIQDGFLGVFEGRMIQLSRQFVHGLHGKAGTVLGTTNRCGTQGREDEFLKCYKKLNLDGVIVAGGDGTFSGLRAFANEFPFIGVPKTIDNDLSGTEITFGYDTACSVVAESVDALRATAEAHRRLILVETMGRTAGWIGLGGGLASYADLILIPERPFDRQKLAEYLRAKKDERGIVGVVSEGAMPIGGSAQIAFEVEGSPETHRLGGIAQNLGQWIEKETGWETRQVVLGHLQRSRSPTTTDRFLTLAMGLEAVKLVVEKAWGQAVVYRHGIVTRAPVEDLMKPARLVPKDHRWIKMAEGLGLFI